MDGLKGKMGLNDDPNILWNVFIFKGWDIMQNQELEMYLGSPIQVLMSISLMSSSYSGMNTLYIPNLYEYLL